MFESSVLFLELNSTKPSLIYDNFNTPESTAAQKQIRKRCFDVHRVLMWYAKKYRLWNLNLVPRTMIKSLSQTYFGHVHKPSTEDSASHRHYFGFPNYVLTHLLTTRWQCGFASMKLKPQKLLRALLTFRRSQKHYEIFSNNVLRKNITRRLVYLALRRKGLIIDLTDEYILSQFEGA